jgi:hypothetical protein
MVRRGGGNMRKCRPRRPALNPGTFTSNRGVFPLAEQTLADLSPPCCDGAPQFAS